MDLCFWGMISVTQRTTPLWCSWHFLLHRSVNSGGVFNSAELLNQFCDTFYHILWKQINSNGETDAMISDQLVRLGLLLVGEKKRKDPDRGFEWKWATGVIQGQGEGVTMKPTIKDDNFNKRLWGTVRNRSHDCGRVRYSDHWLVLRCEDDFFSISSISRHQHGANFSVPTNSHFFELIKLLEGQTATDSPCKRDNNVHCFLFFCFSYILHTTQWLSLKF